MSKLLWISGTALLLFASSAWAQGPVKLSEEVKAKARANQAQADRYRQREHDRDGDRDHDRDHRDYAVPDRDRHEHERHVAHREERDHDRDDHIHRISDYPPGRDHGRKTGWGNCDVPPGQVKKQGCHPYHHHAEIHHARTVSPVVAPRPVAEVHAHAGVDAKVH
jgi:hypothetical protein